MLNEDAEEEHHLSAKPDRIMAEENLQVSIKIVWIELGEQLPCLANHFRVFYSYCLMSNSTRTSAGELDPCVGKGGCRGFY